MNERSIFAAALDITDPTERAAYLDRTCAGDAGLRKHVEELLAAQSGLGSFLDRPAVGPARTGAYEPLAEGPGSRVGPYKLLQEIGEGGMGVVYMAEQEEPVRRKVALKVIKPGMDSRQVVARFEAERQALSMMDHPNIARVFDAGTTDTGRPYFVMELVHGVPITEYCDANKLTPRERLELFVPICQAIQHAHQKGIIHRDVKPSNVLVTMYDDRPVPKVIDFGVAKAVEQRLTEKTLFTQFGTLVGTFEYMSPEQAEMNAFGVDTRSDVYSLGVLLYELLTGTTPLERVRLREAALGEVVRLIKEEEPPRPSMRISTSGVLAKVAAARKTEPAKLSTLVRGELDWIVMRCLEKDRARRYDTAVGLAQDLERYLKDEPVEACPPTLGYRLRKVYRKNRTAVRVASAFVCLMVGAAVASTVLAVQAKRAEARALENEQQALAAEQLEAAQRERAQAKAEEADRERAAAVAAREDLRRTYYISQINLAQIAINGGDGPRADAILDGLRPGPGETDLRGFEWHYLWRLIHSEEKTVTLPSWSGRASVFSRDRTQLLTTELGDPDNRQRDAGSWVVKIRDAGTGEVLRTVPSRFPRVLVSSADASRFAVIEEGGEWLFVYDALTGRALLKKHLKSFWEFAELSPDGKRLCASGVGEGGVFDVDTGEAVSGFPDLANKLARHPANYSPDGRFIGYIQHGPKNLVVVDARSGKEVATIPEAVKHGGCYRVSFSDDATRVMVVKCNPEWRIALGADNSIPPPLAREDTLDVWDIKSGNRLLALSGPDVNTYRAVLSPDGRLVALSRGERTVGESRNRDVIAVDTGNTVYRVRGTAGVLDSGFSRNNDQFFAFTEDGVLRSWALPPRSAASTGQCLGMSSDGTRFLLFGDGRLRLVDQNRKELLTREFPTTRTQWGGFGSSGGGGNGKGKPGGRPTGGILLAALAPSGRYVIWAYGAPADPEKPLAPYEWEVAAWDGTTGRERRFDSFTSSSGADLTPWVFSADGTLAAHVYGQSPRKAEPIEWGNIVTQRGSQVQTLKVYNPAAGTTVQAEPFEGVNFAGRLEFKSGSLRFDSRGMLELVIEPARFFGEKEKDEVTLRRFDPASGKEIEKRVVSRSSVPVMTTDGGRFQVLAHKENPAVEWWVTRWVVRDTQLHREVGSFREADQIIKGGTFSPDERFIAIRFDRPKKDFPAESVSSLLKVYRLADGKEVFTRNLRGGEAKGSPQSLRFTPDGRRLLLSSLPGSGSFTMLDVETGRELIQLQPPKPLGLRESRFTADGTHFLGAGFSEATFYIWDATPLPEPKKP